MRWYDDAKRSRGIDAFLRMWFALETLAMPNTTDIRPLRDALCSIYDVPISEAEREFGIGRTFGLRGLIVHQGRRIDIPGRLLGYLGGVYLDLFVAALGYEAPGRARTSLNEAGGVLNVLPAVVGGRGEEFQARRQREMLDRLTEHGDTSAVQADATEG